MKEGWDGEGNGAAGMGESGLPAKGGLLHVSTSHMSGQHQPEAILSVISFNSTLICNEATGHFFFHLKIAV